MQSNQYQRRGTVLINTNHDELAKYDEARRAIKNRKTQQIENETIISLLKTIMQDIADIKRKLEE
jgi:hypothetical protein